MEISEEKLKLVKRDAIVYLGVFYEYFDSGNTRDVYVNKDKTKVIKLLTYDFTHTEYNIKEEAIYSDASEENRQLMAETDIDDNGVVFQEFCNPVKFDDRPLNIAQTLFSEQCRNEVGWNKDGKLVCFDLDEFKQY